jgi:formylglycine-generating enzyme
MKTGKLWKFVSLLTIAVFSFVFTSFKTNDGGVKIKPSDGSITSSTGIEMVLIPAGTFIMGSPAREFNRYKEETQHSVTLTKSFYMGKYPVTQKQYRAVMDSQGKISLETNTITQKQYRVTTDAEEDRATDKYGKGDNYPVYYVNWFDAIVFCNKLSVMEGLTPVYSISGSTNPFEWGTVPYYSNYEIIGDIKAWNGVVMDKNKNGYRLPTEAEWEYACRGDYPNKATETNTKPFGIGDGTKMISGMANFDSTGYRLFQGYTRRVLAGARPVLAFRA